MTLQKRERHSKLINSVYHEDLWEIIDEVNGQGEDIEEIIDGTLLTPSSLYPALQAAGYTNVSNQITTAAITPALEGYGPLENMRALSINALDFGAIGDGTSHPLSEQFATLEAAQAVYPAAVALTDEIDWCAIKKAIAAVVRGTVYLAFDGIYILHDTLHVPTNVTLTGGGTNTFLRARGDFPTDTPLVQLGAGETYAHACNLSHMTIDCQSIMGSVGVYSDNAQELSGLSYVRIIKWRKSGVQFLDACDNYMLRDLEVWGHVVTVENQIALDLVGTWKNLVHNITIDQGYGTAGQKLLAGIRASGQLHATHIHIEDAVDGVLLDGASTHASLRSITSHDVTNTIRSVSGNLGRWSVLSVFASNQAYSIKNDNLGHAISSGAVSLYAQDGGASSYAVTLADQSGIPSRFKELQIADGTPVKRHISVRPSLTWSAIAAGDSASQAITVTGAQGGDVVLSGPPQGLQASLVVASAVVTAVDTVTLTLYNPTSGSITPTSGNWRISVIGY